MFKLFFSIISFIIFIIPATSLAKPTSEDIIARLGECQAYYVRFYDINQHAGGFLLLFDADPTIVSGFNKMAKHNIDQFNKSEIITKAIIEQTPIETQTKLQKVNIGSFKNALVNLNKIEQNLIGDMPGFSIFISNLIDEIKHCDRILE